ncbi:MAG: exodeoxyribonuclease VII large subunit [Candidatus Omnitrophica bacterium]|nr:exodeoxyribonuclease VII large subunit [Candidatus Omnitrophota bacterium]
MLQVERQIYSVSEITANIRYLLEEHFSGVWVEGEVSNFKLHNASGHMYFSLKDETAQLQCVMFRRENQGLGFELKEGLKVLCFGRISVYPIRGQYQLYVERIEPKGVGVLQLRFEELKEKLRKEGLFEESRKKPIPYLPNRIGLVTSIDGAALHDILKVLDRRFSNVHVLVYPVQVQGAGAAESIARAIDDFNDWENADVLIVGRGGGSLEDLWAFNEEVTARAIFRSDIPVISAVGHEVDFTIADFTADLRAPTPSAAAELVVPLKEELALKITDWKGRLFQAVAGRMKLLKRELEVLEQSRALRDPLGIFEIKFQRLDELKRSLAGLFETFFRLKKEKLFGFLGKLEALGPVATLRRGFSVSLKLPEEKVLTSFRLVKRGDEVKTRLKEGFFISRVEEAGA